MATSRKRPYIVVVAEQCICICRGQRPKLPSPYQLQTTTAKDRLQSIYAFTILRSESCLGTAVCVLVTACSEEGCRSRDAALKGEKLVHGDNWLEMTGVHREDPTLIPP